MYDFLTANLLLLVTESQKIICILLLSNVGSCSEGLRKTQNQTGQRSLLKVIRTDESSSLI